jgi:F-type H+-transporting ATPase subunit epsilon
MAKTLKLDVVTPERQALSQEVAAVVLPGVTGSFGILPGHMPMVAALQPGVLKVTTSEGETVYAIGGGYAEVTADKVIVLADTAERAEEIDLETARRTRAQALAQLKQGAQGAALDAAEISLKKALAQLQVADYLRRHGKPSGR